MSKIEQSLVQSPASTGPLLEEAIGVITLSGLKGQLLGGWADATPVILTEIGVIHEQWAIHVGQKAFVDVFLD
jgi:hypothetical protein